MFAPITSRLSEPEVAELSLTLIQVCCMSLGPQGALNTTHKHARSSHPPSQLLGSPFYASSCSAYHFVDYKHVEKEKIEMACTVLHISLRLCCSVHFFCGLLCNFRLWNPSIGVHALEEDPNCHITLPGVSEHLFWHCLCGLIIIHSDLIVVLVKQWSPEYLQAGNWMKMTWWMQFQGVWGPSCGRICSGYIDLFRILFYFIFSSITCKY